MASVRSNRRHDAKNRLTQDRQIAVGNGRHARPAPDMLIAELAQLVRELHQSLEDYAPVWFTQAIDDRIREKLAAAECGATTFRD